MKKAIAKLKKLNGVMPKADFVAEFDEKLIDGEKIKEYKAPRSGAEMVILSEGSENSQKQRPASDTPEELLAAYEYMDENKDTIQKEALSKNHKAAGLLNWLKVHLENPTDPRGAKGFLSALSDYKANDYRP